MARNPLPPQIKKIDVLDRKTGRKVVRYLLLADVGLDRITGQRVQVRRRFKTEREAREELGKLAHQLARDSTISPDTVELRSPGKIGAKRFSVARMIPGNLSRTSHVLIALIIIFIILLVALGLYAAIAGRFTSQSLSKHPHRPGLLGPHLCLVVTERHQPTLCCLQGVRPDRSRRQGSVAFPVRVSPPPKTLSLSRGKTEQW